MWLTNLLGVEGFRLKLPGFVSGSGRFQSDESWSAGQEGDRRFLTCCKRLLQQWPANSDVTDFQGDRGPPGIPGKQGIKLYVEAPKELKVRLFPFRVQVLFGSIRVSWNRLVLFQGEPGEAGQKGFPGLPVSPSLILPKVFSWCGYQTHVLTSACRGSQGARGWKERRVTEENPAHWWEPETQNNW